MSWGLEESFEFIELKFIARKWEKIFSDIFSFYPKMCWTLRLRESAFK
jgi:hypothetical protein